MRLSLPVARLIYDLVAVIWQVLNCDHFRVTIFMYSNVAKLRIDYRLYPLSCKYAYVVAYLTYPSRPLPADGGISSSRVPDGPSSNSSYAGPPRRPATLVSRTMSTPATHQHQILGTAAAHKFYIHIANNVEQSATETSRFQI